jgi:starvation-inducible DNA-binding protein
MDVAVRHNKKTNSVAAELGLKPKELAKVASGLAGVMADTYLLYLKTQNFRWNVTGPMFGELHALFEKQYGDLAVAVDARAERIRAIGEFAPGSFAQFRKLSKITDEEEVLPAERMIEQAIADNEHVVRGCANCSSLPRRPATSKPAISSFGGCSIMPNRLGCSAAICSVSRTLRKPRSHNAGGR